jgi:hypothetical protein
VLENRMLRVTFIPKRKREQEAAEISKMEIFLIVISILL